VRKELGYVNRSLNTAGYLIGGTPTALDAYLYAVSRWAKSKVNLPVEFPHLHQHQIRMESDPAVAFCRATERGERTQSPSGACAGHVDFAQADA
jgi:glutathione S-transferase